jgi:hypothetical protein
MAPRQERPVERTRRIVVALIVSSVFVLCGSYAVSLIGGSSTAQAAVPVAE